MAYGKEEEHGEGMCAERPRGGPTCVPLGGWITNVEKVSWTQ